MNVNKHSLKKKSKKKIKDITFEMTLSAYSVNP